MRRGVHIQRLIVERVRQMAATPEKRTPAFVVLRSPTTIATPQMVCSDGHIYLALEYLGANRVELVRLDSTLGSCAR